MTPDLRRRLGLALIGLSVSLAGLFAVALWIGNAWLESRTLDQVLGRELEVYIEGGTKPADVDAKATGLRYFRPALGEPPEPPAALQALDPGSYRDFKLGQSRFHLLVREVASGDRAYLLYDVKAFSRRKHWLRLALIGGVAMTALAAWLAGGWISQRALRPLEAVVARIRAIDPAQRGQRLETWPEDGELEAVIAAMNEHMAQLDALVSRERAFAASASHELRTPLAAIRGAAEVLALMPAVPPEVLARIEQAVTEARADLDALLALSQGRELPQAESLALHEVLPRLAEDYAGQAHDSDTRVVWVERATVTLSAAPSVVAIIFSNLLRHAIRAAPGGEIRLGLRADSFVVADNGEGMTHAQIEQAFEPGVKGRHGGSGMGLYISRILAERCGWTLSLESHSGRGTLALLRFAA
jgi:signal transduction histidine kinase